VLVFVTIDAEIFPIGAVRWIIPGIAILMMDGQKLTVLIGKFSAALGANHAVEFQGTFSIIVGKLHYSYFSLLNVCKYFP
jgi:hypothetical protein